MHRFNYPPGPSNINAWIGGTWRHAYGIWRDHAGYMQRLADRYGDIVFFRLFGKRGYLIVDPELIHQTLVANAKSIRKQDRNRRSIERNMNPGLLTHEGEVWRRHRGIAQRAFGTEDLRRYADVAVRATKETVSQWHDAQRIDLGHEMDALIIRLLFEIFFGIRKLQDPHQLMEALIAASRRQMSQVTQIFRVSGRLPTKENRRMRDARRGLQDRIRQVIRDFHAQHDGTPNLLTQLFAAQAHGKIDSNQLYNEATTFMVAGVHTLAAAAQWAVKELIQHGTVQEDVANEICRTIGPRDATHADLRHLSKTDMAIKEALRLHPPVWALIAREATAHFKLREFDVPSGSWLFIYPYITQRCGKYFDNPEKFDPERFSPEREAAISRFAYRPFGTGNHVCIGAPLVRVIMPLILATLLQRFRLIPDCDIASTKSEFSTVLFPGDPLQVRLRHRNSARSPSSGAPIRARNVSSRPCRTPGHVVVLTGFQQSASARGRHHDTNHSCREQHPATHSPRLLPGISRVDGADDRSWLFTVFDSIIGELLPSYDCSTVARQNCVDVAADCLVRNRPAYDRLGRARSAAFELAQKPVRGICSRHFRQLDPGRALGGRLCFVALESSSLHQR